MADTTETPRRQACPADPPADGDANALPNLAPVLRVVQILLTYGRYLANAFDRRSTAPGFHFIARNFGTSNTAVILAHIRRGILRAAALQHVLLRRAERGRDLTLPPLRIRQRPEPAPPDAVPPQSPAPKPAATPRHARRPSWRDDWLDGEPDPLDPNLLPSYETLLAQANSRPIGRSIGDICADLGIAPSLCLASFWNDLFSIILNYNGSPAAYDIRRWQREQYFLEEQDRRPTMDLSWPPLDIGGARRDTIQACGFFIGEQPTDPPISLQPRPQPSARPGPAPTVRIEDILAAPSAAHVNAATGPP